MPGPGRHRLWGRHVLHLLVLRTRAHDRGDPGRDGIAAEVPAAVRSRAAEPGPGPRDVVMPAEDHPALLRPRALWQAGTVVGEHAGPRRHDGPPARSR
ncbi:hypothetical protein [Saccharothrix syringae]|uniref:Uncharacterized protein n=1 Tax=Saccharothrix syringae TaxID=103733 RepID=A0A5Q0GU48_SACSY|nr:hypothetical protein [Saccharothrix syringae]QFZ17587.1 hypothetical protein EKG83_08910 [Saccharothrix syringae]